MKRFWDKVLKTDTCWIWQGAKTTTGYGIFWFEGKGVRAHRFAFGLDTPLPLDHLCSNRACVNPAHLEPVTQAENMRRARPAHLYDVKVECKNGHLFNEVNTYWYKGKRWCRKCRRERKRLGRSA